MKYLLDMKKLGEGSVDIVQGIMTSLAALGWVLLVVLGLCLAFPGLDRWLLSWLV